MLKIANKSYNGHVFSCTKHPCSSNTEECSERNVKVEHKVSLLTFDWNVF